MADLTALDTFIGSNPDPRELKRALAVKMTLGPYPQSQIEDLLGVTTGFISKWKKIYLSDGVTALRLAYRGSQPYLSAPQRHQLLAWLNTQRRTSLLEVTTYVEQRFGVRFKSDQSYYALLSDAGFSWKKSQGYHPKADAKQAVAKREEVKKSSSTGKSG
jgi:putative transposase